MRRGWQNPGSWRLRLAVSGVLLAIAFVIAGGWGHRLLVDRVHVTSTLDEDLDGGVLARPAQAEITGFHGCVSGFCLGSGAAGRFVYRIPSASPLVVKVWLHIPPQGWNRLSLSLDGGATFSEIARNEHAEGREILIAAGARPVLAVDAESPEYAEALVVDKLSFRYIEGAAPTPVPPRARALAAFCLFAIALLPLVRRPLPAAVTLAVVVLAFGLRYDALVSTQWDALEPDADAYRVYATIMAPFSSQFGFYSARFGEREPLYVFAAHGVFALFGSSDRQLRLLSLFASVLLVYAVVRFVRSVAGEPWGLACGAIMALNGPLIAEAPRGLRLECECLLWLLALWSLFVWTRQWDWRRVIAVGTIAGLVGLTRSTYVAVLLVLIPLAVFERRRIVPDWWRRAIAAVLLMVALVAPHRVGMYRHRGDAFWDTAVYARWLANFEFIGRPGFPSAAELRVNGYAGPPISYREYLIGLHTPRELAVGTLRGYTSLYRNMAQCTDERRSGGCAEFSAGLQLVAGAGMLWLLFVPGRRWIPIAFIVAEAPVAFLYDRGLLEPFRHTFQGFPLVLLAAVLPFAALSANGRRRQPGIHMTELPSPSAPAAESRADARQRAVRDHFDRLAPDMPRWRRRSWYYHEELRRLCRGIVPKGASVLELGCGTGDLLAALEPSRGVGIDLSPRMVEAARAAYPHLEWRTGDAQTLELDETFDYVILSDLVGHLDDIGAVFHRLSTVCRPDTRIIVTYYNYLWEPALRAAEAVGQRMPLRLQNWLPLPDIENLLRLADIEVIKKGNRFLAPKRLPLVSDAINRFVAPLPLVRRLGLIEYLVARPAAGGTARPHEPLTCSVVIPCRNERGNIAAAVEQVPEMGPHTEIVFVDGASTDGTAEEVERQIALWRGKKDIRLVLQPNPKGKGEAVRLGFDAAKGDVLMILDADLTVAPEDLPKFYRAVAEGKGDLINGSRLVYPMDAQAMRFLNLLGNKAFSLIFSWTLEQRITDTLCGTKVLRKRDYQRILGNRSFFGDFDPFGDFDLLFGAARLNLKIVELPVRYRERVYGTTKISRFRHGLLLLKMSWIAMKKLKFS